MKILASIEDPMVMGKIVSHLQATSYAPPAGSAKCAVGAGQGNGGALEIDQVPDV